MMSVLLRELVIKMEGNKEIYIERVMLIGFVRRYVWGLEEEGFCYKKIFLCEYYIVMVLIIESIRLRSVAFWLIFRLDLNLVGDKLDLVNWVGRIYCN